jgi:hypothetical protein
MGISHQLVPGTATVLEIRPLSAKLELSLHSFVVRSLLRWADLKRGSVHDVDVLKIPVCFSAVDLAICFGQFVESKSKYPPAEPGALGCEPLKAAERGR